MTTRAFQRLAGAGPGRVRTFGLAALAGVLFPAAAQAACRLALALALDVSGSVDAGEYAQQMDGVAEALANPAVQNILLATPDIPVALSVYEWSASSYQRLIVDWTKIETSQDLTDIQSLLRGWERAPAPEATGLGAALEYGATLLSRAPACWDQTLDVSADGKNNDWPLPHRLRARGALGTMTVNALVVATEHDATSNANELAAYFRARIIQGPGAFVEIANGYDDYADALTQKLLRELATRPIGRTDPATPTKLPVEQANLYLFDQ